MSPYVNDCHLFAARPYRVSSSSVAAVGGTPSITRHAQNPQTHAQTVGRRRPSSAEHGAAVQARACTRVHVRGVKSLFSRSSPAYARTSSKPHAPTHACIICIQTPFDRWRGLHLISSDAMAGSRPFPISSRRRRHTTSGKCTSQELLRARSETGRSSLRARPRNFAHPQLRARCARPHARRRRMRDPP